MKRRIILIGAALSLAACRGERPPLPSFDDGPLLIVNARIPGQGGDAVLIEREKISKIGRAADLRPAGPHAELDAAGALVVPGFQDAHIHLLDGGLARFQVDLEGAKTEKEAAARVAAFAEAHPEAAAIQGRGWSYGIVPKGAFPSKEALDAAVPDRPVVLESYDGHAYWANSKAIEAAGIGPESKDPASGRIVRGPDGRTPAGSFLEAAAGVLLKAVPDPGRERKLAAIEAAATELVAKGFTSVTTMNADPAEFELYAALRDLGRLPLRVNLVPPLGGDLEAYAALKAKYPGPWVRFDGLKAFVDGVIESKTAFLVEPYSGGGRGAPALGVAAFKAQVQAAHCRSFSVAMHAVGDGGVRLALDAVDEARKACPFLPVSHRIEHIELVHPDDLPRFHKLDVVASMQPLHADPGDPGPEPDPWARNLTPDQLQRAFAWKSLETAGAVLAFGSDWPVMAADPLRGIAVAATRRNAEGKPKGGWHPEQIVSAEAALKAFTEGAAYSNGRQGELGRIAPGYWADLVILSPEARLEDPASFWKATVRTTVVAGKIRYDTKH